MRPMRLSWDGENPSIAALVRGLSPASGDAADAAALVVGEVRARGDEALLEFCERYDGARPDPLLVSGQELVEARHTADRALVAALQQAAANVRAVAEAQSTASTEVELREGQRITIRQVPVASAAIYAPGGRASYPSSVVMGVVPARVAGVEKVVVSSPPGPDGKIDESVLAAASIAGADCVYGLGGAHAIAALAYGTESVPSVDVIAGPGGPIVQAAKLLVAKDVGIDGYAGPSELMVLFDGSADLRALALDLCAQAEHGPDGLMVACSPQQSLLEALVAEVENVCGEFDIHEAPFAVVDVPSLEAGAELGDLLAPEHLEIDCEGAVELAGKVRYAGCVFTGEGGATAFGDYAAGSNHVLPTGGAGRFRGPLGPGVFRRPISHVHLSRDAARELAGPVETIAEAEGFPVHARSARARAEG